MAYDPNCLDLAQHFLGDLVSNDLASKLAQHIQDEVESWFETEIDQRGGTKPKLYPAGVGGPSAVGDDEE